MIILGSSSDDKGTQLEELTRAVLRNRGYTNIVRDSIGPGGEEIDLRADYIIPGLGDKQVHRVICECKAHGNPIDISPWHKFLGKVFSEQMRQSKEITGYFIALSGVNGSVAGHYDELRQHCSKVTLVAEPELLQMLSEVYGLSTLERVTRNLRHLSNRQGRRIEPAYYKHEVYWIIVFGDDTYTILTASGDPCQGDRLDVLEPLVESAMAVHSFVNLQEEAEAHQRAISVQKGVLSKLMIDDGSTELPDLRADLATRHDDFTDGELTKAIQELAQNGWVAKSDDALQILFHKGTQNMLKVYRFLLDGEVPVRILGCDYYDAYINNDLLSEIQEIQEGLPLSPDDIKRAIQVLRWSPRALATVLDPLPMIVTHRKQGPSDEKMDANDRRYFFEVLFKSLMADFTPSIIRILL